MTATLDVRLFEPDGRTLYAANTANDAVAVLEPGHPEKPLRGFIPTGWFPTAVATTNDGERLLIAGGYGFGSIAPAPSETELAAYTLQVMRNNRAFGPRGFDGTPRFGDLPQGNGAPALVQFGRDVTPTHHALAEQFVLLDNFYLVGDQSALGHQWADEPYANHYVHKFGNRRINADGTNPMAYAPTGVLWDHARNHGKTVRICGKFTQGTMGPSSATWTDVFLREFREFEENGNLPNLVIMLLPVNHTNGTSPNYPTPRAMVADNDLALGRIVEAISESRYWKEPVILVTEDDAQNGLDHVDGHRTVGLAIGPYVRRKAVDRSLYTTISMFRTIEQILGLPPLKATRGLQRRLALESMKMDFETPDAAPEELLNRAIWHSVKGYGVPYPGR